MMHTPPYRVETERLVIRCYEPSDAPLLKDVVDSSIDHLSPWMPWVRFEPQTLAEKAELLRGFRGQFDRDENWIYGVFSRDESRQLGGSGLHPRGGPDSLEIGYFIRADSIGRGYATELTAALTRVGIELCGVTRIDLQIEPGNDRSLAIPRKLGFTHEGTLRRRLEPRGEGLPRLDSMLFTMLDEELAGSPCMAYDYAAFDVVGAPVGV